VDALEKRARERGLEPVTRFRLAKHFAWRANRADARSLPAWLKAGGFEILHCHRRQDHWVAGRAARKAGVPVLRTLHDGTPLGSGLRDRWLVSRATDRLLYVSEAARARDQARFRWREGFALTVPPAVDLLRFFPEGLGDLREELGIPHTAVVLGLAARVQARRRFDLLLASFRRAARALPDLRLLVIGRGTRIETVALRPVRRLGIADKVLFAGYRRGDYAKALNTLDVKLFLVPGSDGSCRALREAMVLGKPAIVTRRGMLPEIVSDGREGIVVGETGNALTEAMLRLGGDPALRARMGRAAREKATREYALGRQAERVEGIYRDLLMTTTAARA
jgi:glycosyltransferase involved in cell wall biosynthesis